MGDSQGGLPRQFSQYQYSQSAFEETKGIVCKFTLGHNIYMAKDMAFMDCAVLLQYWAWYTLTTLKK